MNWLHEGRLPALSEVWRFGCYKRKNSSMSSLAYHVFLLQCRFALFLRTYYKCELRPILFHDVPRCGLSVSRAKLVAQLFAIRTWSSIKGTAAPAPLGSYRWSLGMSCPCSFSLPNCCIVPYWFVLSLRLYVHCVLYPGMGCVWEVFGTSCPSSLPLLLPSPSRFRFSLLKSTSYRPRRSISLIFNILRTRGVEII